MTEHHHAIRAAAQTYRAGLTSPPPLRVAALAAMSGVSEVDVVPIVRELRARGEWPEGVSVVEEERT